MRRNIPKPPIESNVQSDDLKPEQETAQEELNDKKTSGQYSHRSIPKFSGKSVAQVAEEYLKQEVDKEMERQRIEMHLKLPEGLHWPRIEEIAEVIKLLGIVKVGNVFENWHLDSLSNPDYLQWVAAAVLNCHSNQNNYLKTQEIISSWYISPAVLCEIMRQANKLRSNLNTIKKIKSANAKKAADSRHNKPGGNNDKKKQIQEIWLSGKYFSRDVCAEQECAALNMSFTTARKALINLAKPEKPT